MSNAKSSSPSPNHLNQTSKILNTKERMTIKLNKPSISHDKINNPQKKKITTNFTDYSLTRAPTTKSFTPVSSKRIDKSASNIRFTKVKSPMNKKATNAKIINKTTIASSSFTSTPRATPKKTGKIEETKQINNNINNENSNTKRKKISNYFGQLLDKTDNEIDDNLLIQDKFNLNDIRFSKMPFLTTNNSNTLNNKDEHINHMNSFIQINNSNELSLGDQLETNWDLIGRYISTKEILELALINKQFGVNTITTSITRIETEIEQLNEEISKVKLDTLMYVSPFDTNPNSNNTPYEFNPTTQRAINLLNETSMDKIFICNPLKGPITPCDDILTIYWLYFIIIQRKVPPFQTQRTKKHFWKETCEYFTNRSIPKLGLFIENEIKKSKMDNEMIYHLDLYSMKNYNNKKLSPTYYQNMCNVTGIFVFIIKDVMDHFGIGKENLNDKKKLLKILDARFEIKNKILMKLNNINEKYLN